MKSLLYHTSLGILVDNVGGEKGVILGFASRNAGRAYKKLIKAASSGEWKSGIQWMGTRVFTHI